MGLLARIRRALAGSSDPELVMREQYREFQGLLEANDAALERIAITVLLPAALVPGWPGRGRPTSLGIVRKFGGDIHVTSEPGHGTVFHVCLPRAGAR